MKLNLTVEKKYAVDIDLGAIVSDVLGDSGDDLFYSLVFALEDTIENNTEEKITLEELDSGIKSQMYQVLFNELMKKLPEAFKNYDFKRAEKVVKW